MQVEQRGFWRLLCVREGRSRTYFPAPSDPADSQGDVASLATLKHERFLLPTAQHTEGDLPTLDTVELSSVPQSQGSAPSPDDVVLLLQVNDKFASAEAVEAELAAFTAYLREHRPAEVPAPTVCVVQSHTHSGNGAPPDAPLRCAPGFETGALTFSDTLCDVTFTLRPTSFFQACPCRLHPPDAELDMHRYTCCLQPVAASRPLHARR